MHNNMPRMIKLMRENAQRQRDYHVVNESADEATIYIYDIIGMDFWTGEGITAKQFSSDLDAIKAKTINLRIDSPGGDVFEARAIVTAMNNHPAKFVAYVDSLAASAASVIAVNADEVIMAQGSFMMIHNAWTIVLGDKNDMAHASELLQKIDGTIADDYASKSGMTSEQALALMGAETWLAADEAVNAKLADSIATAKVKNAVRGRWNLSAYDHAPTMPTSNDEANDDQEALRAANERRLALIERIA